MPISVFNKHNKATYEETDSSFITNVFLSAVKTICVNYSFLVIKIK